MSVAPFDIVASPYAGHLFPLLDLAQQLQRRQPQRIRVLTTARRREAVERSGCEFVELLPGQDAAIDAIGNTEQRVGSHPLRLYAQFRQNMALMDQLLDQLTTIWGQTVPCAALVDFVVPLAGWLARQRGIPWWTSCVSPATIETQTGTPSFLGGWQPRPGLWGRLRDAAGRAAIRSFKRTVGLVFRRSFRRWGIPGVYRSDGCEQAYSPEWILGFGLPELEYPREWPPAWEFVGPLTGGPPLPHVPPRYRPARRAILVTLGTHLPWARERAEATVAALAQLRPDLDFHFTRGRPGGQQVQSQENLQIVDYLPYDEYLPRYSAALVHGGTGVIFSCLRAGVPMLALPQDFDHLDYAARVAYHGVGYRCSPRIQPIQLAGLLDRLLQDTAVHARVAEFRTQTRSYDPAGRVAERLAEIRAAVPHSDADSLSRASDRQESKSVDRG